MKTITMTGAADLLTRVPEPELMDSAEQVAAYAGADFNESNQAFVDHLIDCCQPQPSHGRLLDLGCGPADICIRLAQALPGWTIEGIDAGANMLASARSRVADAGLAKRIVLREVHLPDPLLAQQDFNCVVSNSLLHHLPDPQTLWQSIAQAAAPDAWVQVMDLQRPQNPAQAHALVEQYAGAEPEVLRLDFHNSLNAAWRVDEVRDQLRQAGLALDCTQVSDRHWMVSGRIGIDGKNPA
ncbi:MAG: class I SAM-dependent methyltransferase [Wenzhouxiangellaceae bacterium]|nr:class I SAM-dependent methyltransferase [Wenzhouxiangellaceae bacterium]